MIGTRLRWWEGLLVVGLIVALWVTLVLKQSADRQLLIARENVAAAHDTVRQYRLGRQQDSTGYAQSLQQQQVRLDGALRDLAQRERLVAQLRADLRIRPRAVDSIVVDRPPVVDSSTGALVGRLDLTGPPITGHVVATLAPEQPSRWDVHLQPDAIPIGITVGCRKGKPPVLGVTAPAWANVTLGDQNVLDPDICHPPKGRTCPRLLGFLPVPEIMLGYTGMMSRRSGRIEDGPGVMVGLPLQCIL